MPLSLNQVHSQRQELVRLYENTLFVNLIDQICEDLEQWDAYLVCADLCEELGYDRVASALRYLSENKKRPTVDEYESYAWTRFPVRPEYERSNPTPILEDEQCWILADAWDSLCNNYDGEDLLSFKSYHTSNDTILDLLISFPENYKGG